MVKLALVKQLNKAAHRILDARTPICTRRLKEVHFLRASERRVDEINAAPEIGKSETKKS